MTTITFSVESHDDDIIVLFLQQRLVTRKQMNWKYISTAAYIFKVIIEINNFVKFIYIYIYIYNNKI